MTLQTHSLLSLYLALPSSPGFPWPCPRLRTSLQPLQGHQPLPQWCHSRAGLHLPTGLPWAPMGRPEGPCPILASAWPALREVPNAQGWSCPSGPLLPCSWLALPSATWRSPQCPSPRDLPHAAAPWQHPLQSPHFPDSADFWIPYGNVISILCDGLASENITNHCWFSYAPNKNIPIKYSESVHNQKLPESI